MTGAPMAPPLEVPLEADCFRMRSAHDFGAGGATGAGRVASADGSGFATSSLIATDSVSAFDLTEAVESR